MKQAKLLGNNDAMNWCRDKTPRQIYKKYLRCLAAQVESDKNFKYLDAYVLGIEKYIRYCINTKRHRPDEFMLIKSF